MTEQPRNWDKELSDIDKVIARQPAPAAAPVAGAGKPPSSAQRRFVALTWFWTGLAIILAVAHPEFLQLGAAGIHAFGKPEHVLYDVKSLLPKSQSNARL